MKYFLVSPCFSLTVHTHSKLPPRLTDAEQFDVIKVALDHTLAVPPTLIPTSEKKGKDPAFQQVCCCCSVDVIVVVFVCTRTYVPVTEVFSTP